MPEDMQNQPTEQMMPSARLLELEQTFQAIRLGEIDALVLEGPDGPQVFTVKTLDEPYREFLEQMSEGAASISEHGTVLFCNRRFAEMMDRPPESIMGTPVGSLIERPQLPAFNDLLALSVEKEAKGETQLLRADGTGVPVQASLRSVDAEGGGRTICLVATDLTRFKKAEKTIGIQAQRQRILTSTTSDGFWLCDQEGKLLDVNDTYCRMSGYIRDELITMRSVDMELYESVQHLHQRIQQLVRTGFDRFETVHRRKNKEEFDVEVSASYLGTTHEILVFVRDISLRKHAESERDKAECELRKLNEELESRVSVRTAQLLTVQEASPDAILVVDSAFRIISHNQSFLDMWPIPKEISSIRDDRPLLDFVTGLMRDPTAFRARVDYLYAHPRELSHEEIEMKDGRVIDRHSSPMYDSCGAYLGRVWFFRDVTERLSAQKNLTRFRALVDQANDIMIVFEVNAMRIVDINERASVDLQYSKDELLSMGINDISPAIDAEQIQAVQRQIDEFGHAAFETNHRRKDGTTFPAEVDVSAFSSDRKHALAIARDISERRRAQRTLEESEVRFKALIEDASDPVAILAEDGTIRYTSPSTFEMSGYQPQELIGKNFIKFIHPLDMEKAARQVSTSVENPATAIRGMGRFLRKDGQWLSVEATVRNRLEVSPINGLVVTFHDVTDRERSNRARLAMSAIDTALVRVTSELSLAEQACMIMVEKGGYRGAWIGYPQNDEAKSIKVIAGAGGVGTYLGTAVVTWENGAAGIGPTGTAILTRKTQIVRDYPAMLSSAEIKASARELQYLACIAIPFAEAGPVLEVMTLYSDDPQAFDPEEVSLLEQLTADVSFGIEAIRERQQHSLDLERLETTMEATIHALTATMEKRDPYTAGHQVRVSRLCSVIAGELGLEPGRIRGLELAAMIHDVGKIEVPSEILSKPGRLTDLEYSMIKLHAEAGYEILKGIDFPWPVAQIVRQHHERMDGKGYPVGLREEQILLESRILQVADAVEAISSHRPYRAARGLDCALAEIVRDSGTAFDPTVVQACIKVFREKGFEF